jgi:hypothetical protein
MMHTNDTLIIDRHRHTMGLADFELRNHDCGILGKLSMWLEVIKLWMITEDPKLIRYRICQLQTRYARSKDLAYEKT